MPQPLEPQQATAIREWADEEREQTPLLAEALDAIAERGLLDEDEGIPWEAVRDAHYEQLGIDTSRWHVA